MMTGVLKPMPTTAPAAVAAYRLSVQVGNPFSERKLAQNFGRTSRRWARARIAEARQSLTECEPECLRV